MATSDKVTLVLPDGTTFEGKGNLQVNEIHQPEWIFGGQGNELLAAKDQITGSNGRLTEQVFEGAGSTIRTFRIEFAKWEGETGRAWGGANDGDDIIVKMQTLGEALATTPITSRNTAELAFGEYASGGQFSTLNVVPGEIELPVSFGPDESPSLTRPRVDLIEAVDIDKPLQNAWDSITNY